MDGMLEAVSQLGFGFEICIEWALISMPRADLLVDNCSSTSLK